MNLSDAVLLDAGETATSSLDDIFSEEPVDLTTFITDKKFMASPRLSDPQYEAVRYAEQIYQIDLYLKMATVFGPYWDPYRMVNLIDLEIGKGGGKDHICRVVSLRVAYLLLCLKSPQAYYEMPPQDSIHLLNVASSAAQALNAFFKPLTEVAKTGWFKDRCHLTTNKVVWDKHVESLSGHSGTETQEGLNLMLGVADEVDAFKSETDTRMTGRAPMKTIEDILDMLQTSASTRFPTTYKNLRISYPRYDGSAIQTLRKAGQADMELRGPASRRYAVGPTFTWDFNPRFKNEPMVSVPCCPELVPQTYEQDFLDEPEMSMAKYMCRPTRSSAPYFRDTEAIDAARVPRNPIEVDYQLRWNEHGAQVWEPTFSVSPDFRPVIGARYSMHGDLAITGDRAGIAMAHVKSWSEHLLISEDEEGGRIERMEVRPEIVVDFVIALESDLKAHPPREVQIRWARQLAFQLRELGFPIMRYTFDGFQSRDSMQILEVAGIESLKVSTDLSEDPWRSLRDVIYEGRCSIPDNELLNHELLSLTRMPNGRINHQPKGSKDLADAVACAVFGSLEVGGMEDESGETAYVEDAQFETIVIGESFEGLEADDLSWSH